MTAKDIVFYKDEDGYRIFIAGKSEFGIIVQGKPQKKL